MFPKQLSTKYVLKTTDNKFDFKTIQPWHYFKYFFFLDHSIIFTELNNEIHMQMQDFQKFNE